MSRRGSPCAASATIDGMESPYGALTRPTENRALVLVPIHRFSEMSDNVVSPVDTFLTFTLRERTAKLAILFA